MNPTRQQAAAGPARFETLDSLRGVAALVVVFDHCAMLFRPISDDIAVTFAADPIAWLLLHTPLALLIEGRGAVALFFVLSGFVLALPWLRGRPPGYGRFVVRRVCRIWLPYAVAIAVAAVLATTLAPYRPPPVSRWFDTANWTETFTWQVALDHALMLGQHNTFDNAIWSLIHEMRVSLIFPLLVLPVCRWGPVGAAAMVVVLTVLAKVLGLWPAGSDVAVSIAGSLHYAVLFMLGVALAQHAERLRTWLLAGPAWIGGAALTAALALLWWHMPFQEDFCLGVGSVLAIVAALSPGRLHAVLSSRALRALGRISYSLYLIHLLVLLPAVYLLHAVLPLGVIAALVPPLSVVAAWGFNRLVEEPANRLGRRLTAGI